jgi:hypothetical protein
VHERAGKVEPAAHAARVCPHAPFRRLDQPHPVEQRLGAAVRLRPRQPVQRRLELHQLASRHERVERRLLERHADRAAHAGGFRDDVVSGHARRPAGRLQQRRQHPDGGRLPRAVRPQEGVYLLLGHLQVDAGDGDDVVRESTLELPYLDGSHEPRG